MALNGGYHEFMRMPVDELWELSAIVQRIQEEAESENKPQNAADVAKALQAQVGRSV